MKNNEFLHAKKEKLNVKRLLSNELQLLSSKNVDPEDTVYKEKVKKSSEQLNVYNQIMKDAQNEIKLKEAALKEVDGIDIVINDKSSETKKGENANYNFMRKKGKSISMRLKQQKELRATDEGKQKNRETAKQGMHKIRETDEGKMKNRETAKQGMSDIRKTDEGKKKNRETLKH